MARYSGDCVNSLGSAPMQSTMRSSASGDSVGRDLSYGYALASCCGRGDAV